MRTSDVDLLIDATGSGLCGLAYGGLYHDLEIALEKSVDMITVRSLSLPTSRESDLHFRENVQRERRKVYLAA